MIGKHGFGYIMASSRSNLNTFVKDSKKYGKELAVIFPSWFRYFSSYEFPMRTETPIVTHTLASEVSCSGNEYKDDQNVLNQSYMSKDSFAKNDEKRRWLENIVGTCYDKEHIRSSDHPLYYSHRERISSPSYQRISSTIPYFVPPNLPREVLIEPTTHITTLSNGVRVSSQETYG